MGMFSDEKKLKVDEFLPVYGQAKKDKDVGNIEDFTEILKLYDKNGDGKMALAELSHILQSLGMAHITKHLLHYRYHGITSITIR